MPLLLYLIPLISAAIGWLTNFVAVKMLFHPRQPVNLGIFKLQGIFPKRQQQIAERLGKLVADQLLSSADLKDRLLQPNNIEALHVAVNQQITAYLNKTLPKKYPLISLFIAGKTKEKLQTEIMKEIETLTPGLLVKVVNRFEESINVEEIVSEKVSQFPAARLEELLHQLLKTEFRFIELVGAVLGFFIGCLQLLLLYFQGQLVMPAFN